MTTETLKNGATVIERRGDVVLAKFRDEYVTWKTDDAGNAYWGHYHQDDLESAVAEFTKRAPARCRQRSAITGQRCIKPEGHLIAHQWQ